LGRWLGQRYGKFNHVMWILGGDIDPDNARSEIRALGLGLKESAPQQLITYHASSSHSSTDIWPADEQWLDLTKLSGERVVASWFNPRTGEATRLGEFTDKRRRAFETPADGDWVLVLDDAARQFTFPKRS